MKTAHVRQSRPDSGLGVSLRFNDETILLGEFALIARRIAFRLLEKELARPKLWRFLFHRCDLPGLVTCFLSLAPGARNLFSLSRSMGSLPVVSLSLQELMTYRLFLAPKARNLLSLSRADVGGVPDPAQLPRQHPRVPGTAPTSISHNVSIQ